MWDSQYSLHQMRMDALRDEADRERRWRLQDAANGRAEAVSRGLARSALARGMAAVSRSAARLARRLDGAVVLEIGPERLARD
jgi:hypothetical protein